MKFLGFTLESTVFYVHTFPDGTVLALTNNTHISGLWETIEATCLDAVVNTCCGSRYGSDYTKKALLQKIERIEKSDKLKTIEQLEDVQKDFSTCDTLADKELCDKLFKLCRKFELVHGMKNPYITYKNCRMTGSEYTVFVLELIKQELKK